MDVTEIGRRFFTSSADLSGLGIAVRMVVMRGVSTCPRNNYFSNKTNIGPKTGWSAINFATLTSIPNAPTAEPEFIPVSAACTSSNVISASKTSTYYYVNYLISYRKSIDIGGGVHGRFRKVLK